MPCSARSYNSNTITREDRYGSWGENQPLTVIPANDENVGPPLAGKGDPRQPAIETGELRFAL
jgi:hypothetical protein